MISKSLTRFALFVMVASPITVQSQNLGVQTTVDWLSPQDRAALAAFDKDEFGPVVNSWLNYSENTASSNVLAEAMAAAGQQDYSQTQLTLNDLFSESATYQWKPFQPKIAFVDDTIASAMNSGLMFDLSHKAPAYFPDPDTWSQMLADPDALNSILQHMYDLNPGIGVVSPIPIVETTSVDEITYPLATPIFVEKTSSSPVSILIDRSNFDCVIEKLRLASDNFAQNATISNQCG